MSKTNSIHTVTAADVRAFAEDHDISKMVKVLFDGIGFGTRDYFLRKGFSDRDAMIGAMAVIINTFGLMLPSIPLDTPIRNFLPKKLTDSVEEAARDLKRYQAGEITFEEYLGVKLKAVA